LVPMLYLLYPNGANINFPLLSQIFVFVFYLGAPPPPPPPVRLYL
jgi:hypothetical protein